MDERLLVFAGIIVAIGGEKKAVEGETLITSLKEKFPDVAVDNIRKYRNQLQYAGFIDYVDIEDPNEISQTETRVWRLTEVGLKFLNLLENQQIG